MMNPEKSESAEILGILVNSVDHPDYVISLARAARVKGKDVRIHFSGPGVLLLGKKSVSELDEFVTATVCEESLARYGGDISRRSPEGIRSVPASELGRFISACRRYVVF